MSVDISRYTVDGDFGKVRIFTNMPIRNTESLFCYTSVGWHECNDTYFANRMTNGSVNTTILLTISGHGMLEVYGKTFELQEGMISVIPPHTPHKYYTKKGCIWEFYWLHPVDNHASRFISKIVENNEPVFMYNDVVWLSENLEKLISFGKNVFEDNSIEQSKILSDIFHNLIRYKTKDNYDNKRVRDLLEKARYYIEQNYQKGITTKSICAELFISQTHLIRLFKKYLDTTPYQYIESYRISKAANYLAHTSLSISAIAESIGYKSSSNFISQFKKHKNVTPQQYRKNKVYAEM